MIFLRESMRKRLCESIPGIQLDLYNVIVCKRKENAHVKCMFYFYYQCEPMENLASHTFVLVNARFCLHIKKRFFIYDIEQI